MPMPTSANGGTWLGPALNPPDGDLISHQALNLKTNLVIGSGTYQPVIGVDTVAGQLYIDPDTGLVRVMNGANTQWEMVQRSYLDNNPNGFPVNTSGNPNPSDQSTLTFVNATRTLHLAPTGANYKIYVHGIEYTFTTDQTVQITATEGLWYIYFNSSGALTASQSIWDLEQVASVALVYWDNTNSVCNYFADERHLLTMDWRTHQYLHNTVGCRYASGLVISGYTLNSDADADVEIGLTAGSLYDEDLQFTPTNGTSGTPASTPSFYNQPLTKPATIPVYYQIGATNVWRKTTATNFYMLNAAAGSNRLDYNENTAGTWSRTEVADGNFVSYWIFGTNDIDNPIIVIMGQLDNNTLSAAVANDTFSALSIASGLPFLEMKILYRVILQTGTGYAGTTKSKVRQVDDYRNVNNVNTSIIVPSAQYISSVDTGIFTVTAGQLLFNYNLQNVGTGDSPTFTGLSLSDTNPVLGFFYPSGNSRYIYGFSNRLALVLPTVGDLFTIESSIGSEVAIFNRGGDLTLTGTLASSNINQSLLIASSPTFAGLTLTGLTGVLKASAGVVSGGATEDDIADGVTYVRTHNDFSSTYKGYLNQSVQTGASPTFANIVSSGYLGSGSLYAPPALYNTRTQATGGVFGLTIGCNYTAYGEVNLWCTYPYANANYGGFTFYQWTGSTWVKTGMLDSLGNLVITGNLSCSGVCSNSTTPLSVISVVSGESGLLVSTPTSGASGIASYMMRTGDSSHVWQMFARQDTLFFGIAAVVDLAHLDSSGNLVINGYLDISNLGSGGTIKGNLNPTANATYYLGNGTYQWAGLVVRSIYHMNLPSVTSVHAVQIDTNGQIGYTASSIKYKENIRDLSDCSWIYDLKPRLFDYKDFGQNETEKKLGIEHKAAPKNVLGLIAEEVATVNPDMVFRVNDECESVMYEHLPMALLVEVQKLRAEVNELKAQLKRNN